MNDQEFDDLIDCRFPYGDEHEWKRLTDLGRSISPNAHFITLTEICRPPRSAKVTAAQQTRVMRYWAEGFEHPLKAAALECATALIGKRKISVDRALRIMDEISRHKFQGAALVLALYACDDVDDIADTRFEAIKALWERGW